MNTRAVTCVEMREIDRLASEEYGIPVETLMENAGRAAAEQAEKMLAALPGAKSVLVLCGGGNNGGDGFVAARILALKNYAVKVRLFKPENSLKGATLTNFEQLGKTGADWKFCSDADAIAGDIENSGLIVDALLGTGFTGTLTGTIADAIELVNTSGKPVLAVDVPSGLDADTGRAEGPCIKAHVTITMGALKTGFLTEQSRTWTGNVIVADIGFPDTIFELKLPTRRQHT